VTLENRQTTPPKERLQLYPKKKGHDWGTNVKRGARMRGTTGTLGTALDKLLEHLPYCPACHLGLVFADFI